MNREVKAVVFDMDGVIFDSEKMFFLMPGDCRARKGDGRDGGGNCAVII